MEYWHSLIGHGQLKLKDRRQIKARYREVTSTLDELLKEISNIVNSDGPALERAIQIRSRTPRTEEQSKHIPSRYEGLNQLIHYSFCLIAAERLFAKRCHDITIIPCGHESGKGADIEAKTDDGRLVAGEVFCVSPALLPTKLSKSFAALEKRGTEIKFILFNQEALAGARYNPRTKERAIFTFDRSEKTISLLAYRPAEGSKTTDAPLDLSGKVELT